MSRRRAHEADFGSDSFLDVLANMVGILIILIVIAGVRVARGPVLPPPLESAPETDAPLEPSPASAAVVEPELAVVPLEPETDEPDADQRHNLANLDAELAALRAQRTRNAAELKKQKKQSVAAQREISVAEEDADRQRHELDDRHAQLTRLQQSLGERKQVLSALLADFEEARNARAPVTEVKHRLAPISQEVQGEEVHFRLAGNRVSVIPLAALVERVKAQLERQKDWLARHTRHQGTVGPIDGFSLNYTVERQQLSAVEERKMGYGAFRVAVTGWELVPDADLPAETAERALLRGSRFASALQGAPEKATLTFWVYPDSFGLYRRLQEAMHTEGFVVAARPLPEGMPIAGSPHGSRSAGQ